MVGKEKNILVEFDYENIILVDPNKTIDEEGNVGERFLPPENLVCYAKYEGGRHIFEITISKFEIKKRGNEFNNFFI